MPGFPPFGNDQNSRLILFDLAPYLAEWRQEGTAIAPHAVRIERSRVYRFYDEPFIQSVHITKHSCPDVVPNFVTANLSRADVNFEVDTSTDDCPLPSPNEGITLLNTNERCGRSIVGGEVIDGLQFEPNCLVIVVAAESQRELFSEMVGAGRIMTDEFSLSLNYTVATHPTSPNVGYVTSNCLNSLLLKENYERDTLFQDELEELARTREYLANNESYLILWQRALDYRKLMLPPKPPPPPPPPPAGANAPPAPPMLVTVQETILQIETTIAELEARELELVETVDGCFGTRTQACGLPSSEAPNPWLSLDGTPCRGYATLQTRELDYCAYWCAIRIDCIRLNASLIRVHVHVRAGIVRSTRTRPTMSSRSSCSVWVRIAWPRTTRRSCFARQTQRERNDLGSLSSCMPRETTARFATATFSVCA